MIDIYVDLFLVDQWVNEFSEFRDRADTTLLYDEVFLRHGVTYEQFNEAIYYYTGDIETFTQIADETAKRLDKLYLEKQELTSIDIENHNINARNKVAYKEGEFPTDSLAKSNKLFFWPEKQNVIINSYVYKKGEVVVKKPKKAIEQENKLYKDE